MPDSSQVISAATQPPVAAWLTIYLQPGDSMKSLLHSSNKTCVSAARDSNSWVGLLTRGPDDSQGVCNDKVQQDVRLIGGNTLCYTTDTMDIPGSQCNVEKNRLMF
ncbi:hypothetical protein AMECASPLE_033352 [Ameca splendens]|uniref:Uncharacterized protein n=3 Tax=Goodeidae TaxID=28758 RepID=A0ABU7CD02_9TELE|nr:hypothetical protein [Ataeniobius toweri]MED6285617.1 hypothetical protein [Characodon lateralis]